MVGLMAANTDTDTDTDTPTPTHTRKHRLKHNICTHLVVSRTDISLEFDQLAYTILLVLAGGHMQRLHALCGWGEWIKKGGRDGW